MSESRQDQLRNECKKFHKAHPEVWMAFVRLTQSRIDKGFQHYSARAIFHQIRWEQEKPEYETGQEFKLNDHHSPFYARRFNRMYSTDLFRLRRQISQDAPATDLDELGPEDFPYLKDVNNV